MTKRGVSILVLLAIVLSAFSFPVTRIGQLSYPTDLLRYFPSFVEEAQCTKVIDGKTIEVEYFLPVGRRERLSLIGLDVGNTSSYDSRDLPLMLTKQYLEGKRIYLSYDWEGANSDGEILAYVWIPVSTEGGGYFLCWNAVMLLNGFAELANDNFDTKLKILFYEASLFARENKSGVLKSQVSQEPSKEKIEEMEYVVKKYLYDFYWKEKAPAGTVSVVKKSIEELKTLKPEKLSDFFLKTEWDMALNQVSNAIEEYGVENTKTNVNYPGNYLARLDTSLSLFGKTWIVYFCFDLMANNTTGLKAIIYDFDDTFLPSDLLAKYFDTLKLELSSILGVFEDSTKENEVIWNFENTKVVLKKYSSWIIIGFYSVQ